MISVFEHIRDIPYSLAVPMTDPNNRAGTDPLARAGGTADRSITCWRRCTRRLGIEVVYATFPFLWNDPDLRYPPELRQLATGLPVAHHLACRVRINDRWVLVDATWDLPLDPGGFPGQ